MSLLFAQIQQAWQAQDPSLVDKLCLLASQPDVIAKSPIPEHELTLERFLEKILSHEFRQKHSEVQFSERLSMIATLEVDEGLYSLPDRYKIHLILTALWEDKSAYSRAILKQAIVALPLSYGVWKGLKCIYKAAEYAQDYEIFGHIAAKIDLSRFDQTDRTPVSLATKTYMSLRAWRYLRILGQQMPVLYVEAAVNVLASYEYEMIVDSPKRINSWVLNHICFHNSIDYGVNRFNHHTQRKLFNAKGRAFSEVWQRDFEPLIKLLAVAKNEAVRQFATDSLRHDFKTQLRDVNIDTILYLSAGHTHSKARDEMIVWLLEQSPNFEKSKFHDLGLHSVVLKLLYSIHPDAYQYAISYAKSYAQDLSVSELMLLAISPQEPVRKFAINNILSRDPIIDIGVAGWGQLLDTDYHHDIASKQLSKHFTRRDLTPDWFFERLTSGHRYSIDFSVRRLPELYSAKELGHDYFIAIMQQLDLPGIDDWYGQLEPAKHSDTRCMTFVLSELRRLDLSQVDSKVWQYFLLHPLAQQTIIEWIDEDAISAAKLEMNYWHALSYEPDWDSNDYIRQLQSSNDLITTSNYRHDSNERDDNDSNNDSNQSHNTLIKRWQTTLAFDDILADTVRSWLADVRRFVPTQLGFDWLMHLAHSDQAIYREFAIGRINKGFLPADFVAYFKSDNPLNTSQDSSFTTNDSIQIPEDNIEATAKLDDNADTIDLVNQSFLFTGKMQSMTRGDAEKLVKASNGSVSGAVNGKLNYLVIGDEGSPLYGNGRKGSKQLKAETIIAAGAALKIISETAFLQMLSGQSREVSEDETLAGAKALWRMATDDPTAPISELAISYLSHHHQQICMALTDRPVDPDAIIPSEFFSAARVIPLLQYGSHQLRDFSLLVSEYEMANWQPTSALWLIMAESPYPEVTQLLKRALLESPSAANRRYHVRPEQLNADMLNTLIESKKRVARQIGITLLHRYTKFQEVQSLYRLTQSTDREVRYAAVSMLWQHYKPCRTSPSWQPSSTDRDHTELASQTKPETSDLLASLPADFDQLLMLLRRGLFELPPGRLGGSQDDQANNKSHSYKDKSESNAEAESSVNLRPISASRAKLALIETFRDVGLADYSFAALIIPTLFTFTHSAGKMERHACLVAVTRLLHRYPDLSMHLQPVAAN